MSLIYIQLKKKSLKLYIDNKIILLIIIIMHIKNTNCHNSFIKIIIKTTLSSNQPHRMYVFLFAIWNIWLRAFLLRLQICTQQLPLNKSFFFFFLQSCYSGLLEIAVHCSWIANFIGFKSFDGACFLTFIAFTILNENTKELGGI